MHPDRNGQNTGAAVVAVALEHHTHRNENT